MFVVLTAKHHYLRIFVSILFLLCSVHLNGQYDLFKKDLNKKPKVMNYQEVDMKPLHFGFCLGFNTTDFGVELSNQNVNNDSLLADVPTIFPGFHVNIITDFRLGEHWSVRFLPGIIFTQRNVVYRNLQDDFVDEMKIESNILDFPLLFKYKSERINNYRPYVIFGGSVRYDMAAKSGYDEDEETYIKLKKFDYSWEVGFGVDFYNTYFKFSTELKLSVGLKNMLTDKPFARRPEYVRVVDRLTSRLFIFSMHFE